MQVSCPACSKSYEVEPSLLAATAMRVSCERCGGISCIAVDADEYQTNSGIHRLPAGVWQVRRARGLPLALPSLRRLRELVRCGELQPEDEVRRADGSWRALADWQELQGDFADDSATHALLETSAVRALPTLPPPSTELASIPTLASPRPLPPRKMTVDWARSLAWFGLAAVSCSLAATVWAMFRPPASLPGSPVVSTLPAEAKLFSEAATVATSSDAAPSRPGSQPLHTVAAAKPPAIQSKSKATLLELGDAALQEKRTAAALRYFQRAIELGHDQGWLGVAAVHRHRRHWLEARRACISYLQSNPQGAKAALARRLLTRLPLTDDPVTRRRASE